MKWKRVRNARGASLYYVTVNKNSGQIRMPTAIARSITSEYASVYISGNKIAIVPEDGGDFRLKPNDRAYILSCAALIRKYGLEQGRRRVEHQEINGQKAIVFDPNEEYE